MAEPKTLLTLAGRLTQIRDGRSPSQFARELGVYPSRISEWESGASKPHVKFLTILAEKEGVDLHWLLVGKRLRRY